MFTAYSNDRAARLAWFVPHPVSVSLRNLETPTWTPITVYARLAGSYAFLQYPFCLCPGPDAQTTIDQPGGAAASGLFDNSPHSESSGAFFDAASQSQPGSCSSLASAATGSTFQTAQTDSSPNHESGDVSNGGNNSGTEGGAEERRSSQRRRRGAGLASVLGSPSPPRQSRFARFVSSAAAATGLNAGQGLAQQEDSNAVGPSHTGPEDGTKSDQDLPSSSQEPEQDPQQDPQQLKLGSIEPHWRTETDYYAATVALDFLSFAFVALFYQVGFQLLLEQRA